MREGLPSLTNYHFPFWQSFFEGWDATKKKDKVKGGRQEPMPACESWGRAWGLGQRGGMEQEAAEQKSEPFIEGLSRAKLCAEHHTCYLTSSSQ